MKDMPMMTPKKLVEYLLDEQLFEATVRRPPRSRIWVAVYTGAEPGRQVWRSTGESDYSAALAKARKWEAEARRERAASGGLTRKPTIRVRRGSEEAAAGRLSQEEVATLLGISVRAVRAIEVPPIGDSQQVAAVIIHLLTASSRSSQL